MSDGITLILDRRELQVTVEHRALRVEHPDGTFQRYPPMLLSHVIVLGSPMVGCDVWRLLTEHNVPAVLLPGRGHGPAAWLGAGLSATTTHRQAQYALAADADRSLTIARYCVERKLRACEATAAWMQRPAPDTLQLALRGIAAAHSAASLLGVEGINARRWYEWLRGSLASHWGFAQRNRRPPRDPINALLSLGYSTIISIVQTEIEAAGLDPHLGFLHTVVPGRPALALDVAEAFRPWVDAFVVSIANTLLNPEDFTQSAQDGCRLGKETRPRYYSAWSEWQQRWPGAVGSETDGHDIDRCRQAVRMEVASLRTLLTQTGAA